MVAGAARARWTSSPCSVTSSSAARTRAATVAFLGDLLGGRATAEDATGSELTWPGGGRIRVEDAARPGVLRLDATGPQARTADLAGLPVVVA